MAGLPEYLGRRRFALLDGLRAISVLAVIWHHTGGPQHLTSAAGYAGAHGVTLFFAISGYLITTLLLREADRYGKIDLKAFYVRRSLRIFPLYYAVMLLYVVLVAVLERHTPAGREFFGNLIYFATYTSNIFVELEGRVIFYFAWSLATEEQFYLVWPPVLSLIVHRKSRAVALLTTMLVVLVVDQLLGTHALIGVPVGMVGGALLATLLHLPASFGPVAATLGHPLAFPAAVVFLTLTLTVPHGLPFLVHLGCVAVVGSSVVREDHVGAGLLKWRPLAYMGVISYGMYLLHMIAKNGFTRLAGLVSWTPGDGALFVGTAALTVVLAGISHRYFEALFMRFKHRWERSPKP